MTFKVNDLVLCVDARPLFGCLDMRVREGAVYTVAAVEHCCATRLGLMEVRISSGGAWRQVCSRCRAACPLTHFYAWRFVKVGDALSQLEQLRRAQLLKPKRERETT